MRPILCFLVGACTSSSPPELAANADAVTVEMNTAADLAVLDNDVGVDATATLNVAAPPTHGEASIVEGQLHYVPAADYLGDDRLDYCVTNADGKQVTATVAITVGCATCALGTLTLAWDPNAPSDMVTGYRVYQGANMDPATFAMLDDVEVTRAGFDPAAPSVTYDSWETLHLHIGDLVCFAITAYNMGGESPFSNVACKTAVAGSMSFGL